RSLSPKLRARKLHARTPSRQYQKSRRGSRSGRDAGERIQYAATAGPRLQHEEGDARIIDTPGRKIKWVFRPPIQRSQRTAHAGMTSSLRGRRETGPPELPMAQREQRRDHREHEPARLDAAHAAREPVGTRER